MVHGITGFFLERARTARRLSLMTAAVSLVGLGGLLLGYAPLFRRAIERATVRFGFEGPNQFVRRINLMQVQGQMRPLSDLGGLRSIPSRRGGADPRHVRKEAEPTPDARSKGRGLSDVDSDLPTRLISRLANVPVVQSDELVIVRLVQPLYPSSLHEKNIEGKVTVQALIDTVGRVVDIQVLASTGETQFERAVEEALLQSEFRPFRQPDGTREVYAVFRYAFRIY